MRTGLYGRPITGVLNDAPHAVAIKRGLGYPWPPTDITPTRHFVGASSLGNLVDPFNGTNWGISEAAKAAGSRRREMAGYKTAKDVTAAVKAAAQEATTKSRDVGSEIHHVTAHLDAGLPLPEYDAELDPYIDAYRAFLDECGVVVGAVERTLYAPSLEVAGTADRILRMTTPPEGFDLTSSDIVVADLKTKYGKTLDRAKPQVSWCIQLAALAAAEHIYFEESGELLPMTTIHAAVVIVLARDGYALYRVPIEHEQLQHLLRVLAPAANAGKRVSAGVLGRPHVRHLIEPTVPHVTTIRESA